MESTTLLLVVLLIAVLVAIGLLLAVLLRRPEERIGALLRDEQRAGRGELREQLDGLTLQQGQRIDGFGGQLQAVPLTRGPLYRRLASMRCSSDSLDRLPNRLHRLG